MHEWWHLVASDVKAYIETWLYKVHQTDEIDLTKVEPWSFDEWSQAEHWKVHHNKLVWFYKANPIWAIIYNYIYYPI